MSDEIHEGAAGPPLPGDNPGAAPPPTPAEAPKPRAAGGLRFLAGSQAPQPSAPMWQWLGVGLGGTLLVMGLARVAGTTLQEPPRPPSPSVVATQDTRPKPVPSPPSLLTVTARPIGDMTPTDTLDPMHGDAGHRNSFARHYDKKHPPPKYSYPAEQMAVDGARAALDAKDVPRAMAILDQYDKDYPGGVSSTDARALRIEALAMLHKSDEAMRLADQFLEDYPHSPRAERVRALKQALASQ